MVLPDWQDVTDSRANADAAQDGVNVFLRRIPDPDGAHPVSNGAAAVCAGLNAIRYEIRAAGQLVAHAVGEVLREVETRR